ncbi:hypothetical protein [Streptomyces sp. cg35]|uniref:hypothetical protein n=1 Tax=Streptomyces sp. cg35 TaxID=3421650 RepID=UPI003D1680FD
MTARLSPQRETEIRERAEAATPGPWGLYEYGHGGSLIEVAADLKETGTGYTARRGVARFDEEPLDNDPAHTDWTAEEDWAQVHADAEFTAHAREDVPALLAELAAVRAERDEARTELAKYEPLNPQQCREGKHADWLVDSEFTHACPWCQIEDLKVKAERDLDEVMKERDEYHEVADKLADAVAPIEVIGEHSSMNDPWANALDLITPKAEVDRLQGELEKVAEHVAKRAEYVTAINNCHPNNRHDYWRWQGHAESRRQLAQQLGLPVAWPAKSEEAAR